MNTTELTKLSTSNLFDLAARALCEGRLQEAHRVVDEMCRPERKGTCRDLLSTAWPALSAPGTQGLIDRIEQYNAYAS